MPRRVLLGVLLVVAACESASRHDDAHDAQVAMVPADAAPPPRPVEVVPDQNIPPEWGYDFRAVALQPERQVGQAYTCVIASVRRADTGLEVGCRGNEHITYVRVTDAEGHPALTIDVVAKLHVDAAGDGSLAAITHVESLEGRKEQPEPPSRCLCKEERREKYLAEHPPPAAYDFARVAKDRAWGDRKICHVGNVGEVERVSAGAPSYRAAGRVPPDVGAFAVNLRCTTDKGSTEVTVFASDPQSLLAIQPYDYLAITVWSGTDRPVGRFGGIPRRARDWRE